MMHIAGTLFGSYILFEMALKPHCGTEGVQVKPNRRNGFLFWLAPHIINVVHPRATHGIG